MSSSCRNGGRQTANAENVRSRDPLCRSREKNTRCLISLMPLYGALSHVFPVSYVISCKNYRWLLHFETQCWRPIIGMKTFFRRNNDGYARKKVENIVLYGLNTYFFAFSSPLTPIFGLPTSTIKFMAFFNFYSVTLSQRPPLPVNNDNLRNWENIGDADIDGVLRMNQRYMILWIILKCLQKS